MARTLAYNTKLVQAFPLHQDSGDAAQLRASVLDLGAMIKAMAHL